MQQSQMSVEVLDGLVKCVNLSPQCYLAHNLPSRDDRSCLRFENILSTNECGNILRSIEAHPSAPREAAAASWGQAPSPRTDHREPNLLETFFASTLRHGVFRVANEKERSAASRGVGRYCREVGGQESWISSLSIHQQDCRYLRASLKSARCSV